MVKASNAKFFLIMLFAFFTRGRSRATSAFLAISIGATALFAMLTIYYDLPDRLSKAFRVYGANMILVGDKPLSKEDIANVKEFLPKEILVGIAPYAYKSMRFKNRSTTLAYTDLNAAIIVNPYWQIEGQTPQNSKEALLGSDLADQLDLGIGSIAKLEDIDEDITISGIIKTGGAGDGFLYLDIAALGDHYLIDLAEVSASLSGEALETLKNSLQNRFANLTPKLVKRVANSEATTLKKIEALVALATIVVLALTMICVSTTMTAIVLERLKEIGLKKALGADSKAIVIEFLSESLILGFLGGAFGCVLGYIFANFTSVSVFDVSVSFSFTLAIISTIISLIFTALAAIFPVYSAANINPIETLRGE
ncbi:MAG: ABC transporter permease [Helicobacteraceae bacterium]|jgi:putative ABC transport system permease protein|nr:ABC transporter permease [Helicobacteraceae bacterium]